MSKCLENSINPGLVYTPHFTNQETEAQSWEDITPRTNMDWGKESRFWIKKNPSRFWNKWPKFLGCGKVMVKGQSRTIQLENLIPDWVLKPLFFPYKLEVMMMLTSQGCCETSVRSCIQILSL